METRSNTNDSLPRHQLIRLALPLSFSLFALLALALAPALLPNTARAQSLSVNEDELKAAFLVHFGNYISYPPDSMKEDADFQICIYGNFAFPASTEKLLLHKKRVKKRRLKLHALKTLEDTVSNCQVLFISKSEHAQLDSILSRLDQQPVLTASDITGFAKAGGIIEMKRAEAKIQLVINNAVARKCKLKISSRLLALATVVES